MATVTVEQLLGGPKILGRSIQNDLDLYELSRSGIPKKALLHLTQSMNLSVRAISLLLHITERTIQRKKDHELLDEATSEQVLQLAEVFSRGNEVFDSSESFRLWLNTPHQALGQRKPMDLLASRFGIQMVLDELGRIEHGIFS